MYPYEPPNTPSPPQQPARSGSHRHGDTTTIKRGVGPVDGRPQPIWPKSGPPRLAPEGGPGPRGQSKGTWTLGLYKILVCFWAFMHDSILICTGKPDILCKHHLCLGSKKPPSSHTLFHNLVFPLDPPFCNIYHTIW